MGQSELIAAIAPLRLVAIGGFLAVSLFRNRDSSVDIDCLIDPNVTAVEEYKVEVRNAIRDVAYENDLPPDWLNDEMAIFIARNERERFFLESVEQQLVIYDGEYLQVYAGSLIFALECKLRRLDHSADRDVELDLSDAIAILEYLTKHRQPYSTEFVKNLDANRIRYPIRIQAVQRVAERFVQVYGRQAIVDFEYDDEQKGYRYKDLEGNWVRISD